MDFWNGNIVDNTCNIPSIRRKICVLFVGVVLVNVGGLDAKRCRIPQEEEKAW